MKRSYWIIALLAMALLPTNQVFANRGPFSAIYQLHFNSNESAYLGVIESIHKEIPDPTQPKQYSTMYTLKVDRTWRASSVKIVSIADVSASRPDGEFIRGVSPVIGEEWIVFAFKDAQGVLRQDSVKALKIDSAATRNAVIAALRRETQK